MTAGEYTGGQVITVLLAAIIGGASLGQAGPNIAYFQNGCVAAKRVFDVINRCSLTPRVGALCGDSWTVCCDVMHTFAACLSAA